MQTTGLLQDRMGTFLDRYGIDTGDVLAQVDDTFGDALLVVAAGSVVAGYGNATSDLDLCVVVPGPVPSQLPVMAYPGGARIDVVFHDAGLLTERHDEVVADPWPPRTATPDSYARRRKMLDSVSRLGQGLPLTGTSEWIDWHHRVGTESVSWLADWYAVDAVRKRLAARLLRARNPRLAALRAGDALLAALERRAVTTGEPYFKWKWVGEKLARSGDREGYSWLEWASQVPLRPEDCDSYLDRAEELLGALLHDVPTGDWRVRVELATGVDWHDFGATRLASRWQLRTVAVAAGSPVAGGTSWDLGLDEQWHPDLATLFEEDLLWLGIRSSR